MSETISVKERIERQLVAELEKMDDVGLVQRWSALGVLDNQYSVVLYPFSENGEEGSAGVNGHTAITAQYVVSVLVAQANEDSAEASAIEWNRWLARVIKVLMANPFLIEDATGEQLAHDTRYIGADIPDVDDDQPGTFELRVLIEVQYDIQRNDPYVARGVTERTV